MSLTLYVAHHPCDPDKVRLLVARSLAQADSMVPPAWKTRVCPPVVAYRFAKVGVELEYYRPEPRGTK